jgi:hypothetical protein
MLKSSSLIEISSNGQNCSILSQKVPKFELYKHNDELFNIYYGIFYELWTFTDFDRLWNLKKGQNLKGDHLRIISAKFGWDWFSSFRRRFFLISSPLFSNLHNRSNDPWLIPFQICVRQHRLVSKMAAITKNINFFKWPKTALFILDTRRCWRTQFWKGTTQGSFQQSLVEIGSVVLYKHNDELFNIYYGIFYELWTFAYFDRLCKLENNFERGPPKDHFSNVWLRLAQWFQRRRFF